MKENVDRILERMAEILGMGNSDSWYGNCTGAPRLDNGQFWGIFSGLLAFAAYIMLTGGYAS